MRKSQRIQFPGHRGIALSGILEIPAQPPRGWMLFSHCFTCTKDLKAIVRISRGLAEKGWGVLRYDFAGLGSSEGDFAETNFTTNCEDLQKAAEYLSAEFHAPRFLIGHSFGGAASFAMADRLPSVTGVIGIAAPSDTWHLAKLLTSMAPGIESEGRGTVAIGGQTYTITQPMVDDFRRHRLAETVRGLRKAMLIFHSPEDETVHYGHALINAGFQLPATPALPTDAAVPHSVGLPEAAAMPEPSGLYPRTLVSLPCSNHLLTSSDRDIPMMVGIIDAWCERWV
jgi:uncharacterized protein